MALPGSVVAAPVGSHGFDTDSKLNAAAANRLRNAGFAFCIRYLSLGDARPIPISLRMKRM